MMTPPASPPQAYPPAAPQPTPPAARPTRPSRFGLFFGIVATILTLAAIALAIFAPQLNTAPTLAAPQGWQQVYNDNPATSSGQWDTSAAGCTVTGNGLDVASDGSCPFQPANGASLANGVLVIAQLAPAADVSVSQDAGILLDNAVLVIITQQGDYKMCRGSCETFSQTGSTISGSTVAWHADALVSNEIAVLYNADQGTVSFYVNGQYVNQMAVGISATPSIALTTSSSGEAIFTHVAIYAGSLS